MSDALDTIAAIGSILNLWLGIGIFLAIAWPFALLLTAALLSPQNAITVIPIVSLLPVLPAFFCLVGGGVAIFRMGLDESGRKALGWLAAAIGFELVIGVYLSTVPVSNDIRLIPLLILVVLAACFLSLGGVSGTLVRLLVVIGVGITILFLLGGRGQASRLFERIKDGTPPPSTGPLSKVTRSYCPGGQDLSQIEIDTINVSLRPDCFQKLLLPANWATYQVQKTNGVSDWASVWCGGRPNPSAAHLAGQDFAGEFEGCGSNFFLEGQGTLTLTRTPTTNAAPQVTPTTPIPTDQPTATQSAAPPTSASRPQPAAAAPTTSSLTASPPATGNVPSSPGKNFHDNQTWRRFSKKPAPPAGKPQ